MEIFDHESAGNAQDAYDQPATGGRDDKESAQEKKRQCTINLDRQVIVWSVPYRRDRRKNYEGEQQPSQDA
ncbi:hypothetical protein [Rhizobium tubonense]|uniref:hypothetical protein n=1 Tax=Rhizobium tubonense TaxID=484088 RepID=UPI0018A80983|nr:hypothetical protein [Rhizobium tubonense]